MAEEKSREVRLEEWIQKQKEAYCAAQVFLRRLKLEWLPLVKKYCPPPPVITTVRQQCLEFFRDPEISAVCGKCRGHCCQLGIESTAGLICLLRACCVDDRFELPEPDWDYLRSRASMIKRDDDDRSFEPFRPCLFLASSGCALGEHRPVICLTFKNCRWLSPILDVHPGEEERCLHAFQSAVYEWKNAVMRFIQTDGAKYFEEQRQRRREACRKMMQSMAD